MATNGNRRGGGIEPLHVPMPHELKSCPSTSPIHPGPLQKLVIRLFGQDMQFEKYFVMEITFKGKCKIKVPARPAKPFS
jgi:hypothetical protein